MRQMYNDLHSKGLEVVLVTQFYGYFDDEKNLTPDQEFAKLDGYLKKWELPFPLVVAGRENARNYGVNGIPHYAVIGRDGRIASWTVGYNEELHNQLRKSVEAELAKAASQ